MLEKAWALILILFSSASIETIQVQPSCQGRCSGPAAQWYSLVPSCSLVAVGLCQTVMWEGGKFSHFISQYHMWYFCVSVIKHLHQLDLGANIDGIWIKQNCLGGACLPFWQCSGKFGKVNTDCYADRAIIYSIRVWESFVQMTLVWMVKI